MRKWYIRLIVDKGSAVRRWVSGSYQGIEHSIVYIGKHGLKVLDIMDPGWDWYFVIKDHNRF